MGHKKGDLYKLVFVFIMLVLTLSFVLSKPDNYTAPFIISPLDDIYMDVGDLHTLVLSLYFGGSNLSYDVDTNCTTIDYTLTENFSLNAKSSDICSFMLEASNLNGIANDSFRVFASEPMCDNISINLSNFTEPMNETTGSFNNTNNSVAFNLTASSNNTNITQIQNTTSKTINKTNRTQNITFKDEIIGQIEIGKPVLVRRTFLDGNITIPDKAYNITQQNTSKLGTLSTEAEFYLPAPILNVENKTNSKIIKVESNVSIHYTDVLTSIPFEHNLDDINLYYYLNTSDTELIQNPKIQAIINRSNLTGYAKVDVKDHPEFNLTLKNNTLSWITPQLSTQIFELEILILNVQSYPTVGGNWTVAFNTTGTANLTIEAINGTEYGVDLEFLDLRCGDKVVDASFNGVSVFIEDWNCSQTGYHVVRVLTGGHHYQKFEFGNMTEVARNNAVTAPGISVNSPENDTTISVDYTEINVSITNASDLANFSFEWEGSVLTTPPYDLSKRNFSNYPLFDYANDGLILAMNFDNDSDFVDMSFVQNDGVNYGSTYIVDGKYGGARGFGGDGDYVDLGPLDEVDGATELSVFLWVKFPVAPGLETLVSKSDYASQSCFGIRANDEVTVFVADTLDDAGGNRRTTSSADMTTDTWYYVGFVFNGSESTSPTRLKIYVDSELQATGGAGTIPSSLTSNTYNVLLGKNPGFLPQSLDGYIDDVRIWNRALSASEISAMYEYTLQKYSNETWEMLGNQTNLNDGTYTYSATAVDSYGNSNTTGTRYLNIDLTAPNITNSVVINASGSSGGTVERGDNFTINATIIEENVDSVWVTIWQGVIDGPVLITETLQNIVGNIWSVTTESLNNWTLGTLNYTIYTNDTLGNNVNKSYYLTLQDTTPPFIEFQPPTLPNNSLTPNDYVEINVSINESDLKNLSIEFNGSIIQTPPGVDLSQYDTNSSLFDYSDEGLVLAMNFDNVSAFGENDSYAVDLSGNGNEGVISGGVSYTNSGKYSRAMNFDGISGNINLGTNKFKTNNQGTISAWINPDSGDAGPIFVSTFSGGRNYLIFTVENNKILIRMRNDANYYSVRTQDSLSSGWQLVTVTSDGTAWKLYVSGVEMDLNVTNAPNNGNWFSDLSTQTHGTYIGYNVYYDAGYHYSYFDGSIDEVRVWNRILSDSEIQELYYGNLRKYDTDSWKLFVNKTGLDHGKYNYSIQAYDSSGNSNSISRTVTLDTTNPEINITYPTNNTYYNYNTSKINYTINETNPAYCWYSNTTHDSTPQIAGLNFTDVITKEGWNNFTVYCNDSVGNLATDHVYYFKDSIIPDIIFNPPTLPNNSFTPNNYVEINVTINETNLKNISIDWIGSSTIYSIDGISITFTESSLDTLKFSNGTTNARLFDNDLRLMMNLDNVPALGEYSTHVVDVSGNGNNGTVTNAVSTTDGKYGGAFDFDGSGDYVSLNPIDINSSITMSAWVYSDDFNQRGFIIIKKPIYTNWEMFFWDNQLWIRGGGLAAVTTSVPSNSAWHHVAGTIESTNGAIYIDGELANSGAINAIRNQMSPGTNDVLIGTSSEVSGNYFNGLIDEVRVWNRSLSADEIKGIYYSNLRKYDIDKWNLYTNQTNNLARFNISINGNNRFMFENSNHNYQLYINQSAIQDAEYEYPITSSDTSGNSNSISRTVTVDTTEPTIEFKDPTEDNNSWIETNTTTINITINDTYIDEIIWNWNNQETSIYNDDLHLMLNFDNNSDDISDHCYDNETQILTENGWKYFKDLKEEKVATLNKNTFELEYQQPIEKQVFNNKGDMYKIILEDNSELLVSEKHRVFSSNSPVSQVMMAEPNKYYNLFFQLEDKNKTSNMNSFIIFEPSSEIFEMGYRPFIKKSDLIDFFDNCSEKRYILSLDLLKDTLYLRCINSHNESHQLLNSSIVFPDLTFPSDPTIASMNSLLRLSSSTGCQSIFSQNNLSSLEIEPFFLNSSNILLLFNLSLATSDQFIQDNLSSSSAVLSSKGNVILTIYNSPLLSSSFSLFNLSITPLFATSDQFISGNTSNFSLSSLGIDTVNLLIDTTSNCVYAHNCVEINKSSYQLRPISEIKEGYFLNSENLPVRIRSISKIPYSGKIYDVDVENDIVLVRRDGNAFWSGNSNPIENYGTTYTTGKYDQAANFSSSYIQLNDSLNLGNMNTTFAFWFKPTTIFNSGSTQPLPIMSMYNNSDYNFHILLNDTTGKLDFHLENNGYSIDLSSNTIEWQPTWHNIILNIKNQTIEMYVDGELDHSENYIFTDNTCYGTESACDTIETSESCGTQQGCAWGTVYNKRLNQRTSESCTTICSNYGETCVNVGTDGEATNKIMRTCTFPDTLSSVSNRVCNSIMYPVGGCDDQTQWTRCRCETNLCSGIANTCSSYSSELGCDGQSGCSWLTEFPSFNQILAPLKIGADQTNYFKGSIDSLRIYNRSFSADQIKQLYYSNLRYTTSWELTINESNLIDGSYNYSATVIDSSTNQNSTETRTINVDLTYPKLAFVPPTLSEDEFTSDNYVEINVTINESNLANITLNWDGTKKEYEITDWIVEGSNSFTNLSDSSLILAMNLDNVSSIGENETHVVDLTGDGPNGTVVDAIWNSSGEFGGAYDFDGNLDYIDFGTTNVFNQNTFTISLWFKREGPSAQPGTYNGQGLISVKKDSQSYDGYFIYISETTDNLIYRSNSNIGVALDTLVSNFTVMNNTWTHLVFTRQQGGLAKFYINGNLDNQAAVSGNLVFNGDGVSAIGQGSIRSTNRMSFNGEIDEIRYWNKVLSNSEIKNMHNTMITKHSDDKWVLFINKTSLPHKDYPYSLTATDNSGNQVTITNNISVDLISPYFTYAPATYTVYNYGLALDLNATDKAGLDTWTVNNSNFNIDSNGILTNTTQLPVGSYILNITINDTVNNVNWTIINITSPLCDYNGGNWDIIHTRYCEDTTINLTGNLILTGNLTLNNVTLITNSNIINNSGNLIVNFSNMTNDLWNNYPSSTLNILDSYATGTTISNNNSNIQNLTTDYLNIYSYYTQIELSIIQDLNLYQDETTINNSIIYNLIINQSSYNIIQNTWFNTTPLFYTTDYNNTIENNTIRGEDLLFIYNQEDQNYSNEYGAIIATESNNITIKNIDLNVEGIFFYNVTDSIISHTNTTDWIYLQDSINNTLVYLNINTTPNSIYSVNSNTTILDSTLNGTIYINGSIYIINSTYNHSDINFKGDLYNQYYLYTYVYFNEAPLAGVNISVLKNDSTIYISAISQQDGYIPQQIITEYKENATDRYYISDNFTVQARNISYVSPPDQYIVMNRSHSLIFLMQSGTYATYNYENMTVESQGEIITYPWNITITNSYLGEMYDINFSNDRSQLKIRDVDYIWDNCSDLDLGESCMYKFNITLEASVSPLEEPYQLDWNHSWTNTDGTNSSRIVLSTVGIISYPQLNFTDKSIVLTENLSIPHTYVINITNNGNIDQLNVNITTDLPFMSFYSPVSVWKDDYWSKIPYIGSDNLILEITINVTDFTEREYTGVINATSYAYGYAFDNISVYLNVDPEIVVSDTIDVSMEHNTTENIEYQINNTGNAKITDLGFYYEPISMPLDWVDLEYISGDLLEGDTLTADVNVTVPLYQDPGIYTGILHVNSTNQPLQNTTFSIEVLPDGSWHFTPLENQTYEFMLNEEGTVNLTLHNTGNIPLNFSITYIDDGLGGINCYDIACLASGNPDWFMIEKNSTDTITVDINDQYAPFSDIRLGVRFSNSSADPVSDTAYYSIDIIDNPPYLEGIQLLVGGSSQSYVELYKDIIFQIFANDDSQVNTTTAYFNVTWNGTEKQYIAVPHTDIAEEPYMDKWRFTYEFNETYSVGTYLVEFYVEDDTGHSSINTTTFDVLGSTTGAIQSVQVQTSNVSYVWGNNVTIPFNFTNTGLVTAYNVSCHAENMPAGWISYDTYVGTVIDLESAELTIFVPARTTVSTYMFDIVCSHTNPDTTVAQESGATYVGVLGNNYFDLEDLESAITLDHGNSRIINFTIRSLGNEPTTVFATADTGDMGINVTYSKDMVEWKSDSQLLLSNIPPNATRFIYLNISSELGLTQGDRIISVSTYSDTHSIDRDSTVTIPISYDWSINRNNLTINGVYGQDDTDTSFSIVSRANVPLQFNFTVINISYVTAPASSIEINELDNYSIPLDYSAPQENNNYHGTLRVFEELQGREENITLTFNSYFFDLEIQNIYPTTDIIAGDMITLDASLYYGTGYITSNVTYEISVNGTGSNIQSDNLTGNYTQLIFQAPDVTDNEQHDLELIAHYDSPYGMIDITLTNESLLDYIDVTPPVFVNTSQANVPLGEFSPIEVRGTDNDQISNLTIVVTKPGGSTYQDTITNYNIQGENYIFTTTVPFYELDERGQYDINYTLKDRTGNSISYSTYFDVFVNGTFYGNITDIYGSPIETNFSLYHSVSHELMYNFTTVDGIYNLTMRSRNYSMIAGFKNITLEVNSIDLSNISQFFQLDTPNANEFGYTNTVVKGFVLNTSIRSAGSLLFRYTDDEMSGVTIDYVRLVKCGDWSFDTRTCNGFFEELLTSTDKTAKTMQADISIAEDTAAYFIAEIDIVPQPDLFISDYPDPITIHHGESGNASISIASDGQQPLTNIIFTCHSGSICNFNVSADTISSLSVKSTITNYPITIDIPKYTPPGSYEGVLRIQSNLDGTYPQQEDATLTVIVPEDNTIDITDSVPAFIDVGTYIKKQVGTIQLKSEANIDQEINITTDNDYLIAPESLTISPGQTKSIDIEVSAPHSLGFFNTGLDIKEYHGSYVLSVAEMVNITNISKDTEILPDDLISLYATTNGPVDTNWSISVGSVVADIIGTSYVAGVHGIVFKAPDPLVERSNYTLKLTGSWGSDAADITYLEYKDIFAPTIDSFPHEVENSPGLIIPFNVTDINGLSDIYVTVTSPTNQSVTISDTTTNISYFNATDHILYIGDTYLLKINLTELGTYEMTFHMTDNSSNKNYGTQTFDFDLFEYIKKEVDIREISRNTSVATNITILNQGTNAPFGQYFCDGRCNLTVHNKVYDIMINAFDTIIRLNNIYIPNITGLLDMEDISPSYIMGIPSGASPLRGVAIRSDLVVDGYIEMYYEISETNSNNYNQVHMFRCSNWSSVNMSCITDWTQLNSTNTFLYIRSNIDHFSAYALAEVPTTGGSETNIYTTNNGGGGGGGISNQEYQTLLNFTNRTFKEYNFTETKEPDVIAETENIELSLDRGEVRDVFTTLRNRGNDTKEVHLEILGNVRSFIELENESLIIPSGSEQQVKLKVHIPKNASFGTYTGNLAVDGEQKRPITINVKRELAQLPRLTLTPLSNQVLPGEDLKIQTVISNPSLIDSVFTLRLDLLRAYSDDLVATMQTNYSNVGAELITVETLDLDESISLGDYYLRGTISYMSGDTTQSTSDSRPITVGQTLWEKIKPFLYREIWFFRMYHLLLALLLIGAIAILGYEYAIFIKHRRKYDFQVFNNLIPKSSPERAYLGHIAESTGGAFFDLEKLTTHCVVAGSTGGGKTVAAQVLVEEALKKNVAVLVFDPTAQWTGFLSKCRQKYFLNLYSQFGMSKKDARSFDGNIHTIYNTKEIQDITEYMRPGEIHIFPINTLTTAEIDLIVANTINQIFRANLDESHKLKVLIVYDEVHRLLTEYGGSGKGFLQIERACREFRKWGVGMILISQILSDFVGKIKANIGTEIQMRTKDENDQKRIKEKYGDNYMKSIIKASTGYGLLANSEYNKGLPYFVNFRPLLHSAERLSDVDLHMYSEYNEKIEELLTWISQFKEKGFDVFDYEIEYKLMMDKLVQKEFSMVEIYLNSLRSRMLAEMKKRKIKPQKRKKKRVKTFSEIEKESLKK